MKIIRGYYYDRLGEFKFNILCHPLFFLGLTLKVLAAFCFSGLYFGTSFIPFVKSFIQGGGDPYARFLASNGAATFPYPSAMLYILTLPGLAASKILTPFTSTTSHFELELFRIPLILADILILLVMARWLRNKEREILIFYWLSPILFFITYIHGQLDVLPIALALLAYHLLFRESWFFSAIILGLAIATKFHILIILPLAILYIYRRSRELLLSFSYFTTTLTTFALLTAPNISSSAFRTMVFENPEQGKVFDLTLSLGNGHIVYIIPLVAILFLARALTFRFVNQDVLLMLTGFALSIFVLLIPPSPGWYFWVIPFLVYFSIKHRKYAVPYLSVLTVLYFAYFASTGTSIQNIIYTALFGVLLLHIIWIYRHGVTASVAKKFYNTPYLLGVAGDSGSGKTTLAELLTDIIGEQDITVVEGDAMHKWERGDVNWESMTHLHPEANHLHEDIPHITALKNGGQTLRRKYDHSTGKFTNPLKLTAGRLTLVEGLHALYLPEIRHGLDLKIFVNSDEELRTHRKLRRDMNKRGATKEAIIEQMNKRITDADRYINPQAQYADMVISQHPRTPIGERLGEDFDPEITLSIASDFAVDYEELLTLLSAHFTVTRDYNREKQVTHFDGAAGSDKITRIAQILLPELFALSPHAPKFKSGYNGIIQLMVCYRILRSLPYDRSAATT